MNTLLCSGPSGFSGGASADRKSFKAVKTTNKITAAKNLPLDLTSEQVPIEDLLVDSITKRERPFSRITISNGTLQPEITQGAKSEIRGTWIRQLKLAANVHYQNVCVEVAKGRTVRVRCVADVKIGEEVQLWFSPEILLAMQIPFLSPANIKGQNVYCCHECSQVFEDPNPLKLHLARNCDSLSLDTLWQRLRSLLPPETESSTTPVSRISAFHPVSHNHHHQQPTNAFNYADPNHLAASHLETIVSNMGTSKQGHLCIYCGKLYSRKYGLKIHIRTHTGFKPLKCKFCHRPFGDPSNLNKHIRLHLQNQSPTTTTAHSNFYKCHLCSKIMIRKRDLQRHIELRHFPEDPHSPREHCSVDSVSNISSSNSGCSSNGEEDEDMEEPDVDSIL